MMASQCELAIALACLLLFSTCSSFNLSPKWHVIQNSRSVKSLGLTGIINRQVIKYACIDDVRWSCRLLAKGSDEVVVDQEEDTAEDVFELSEGMPDKDKFVEFYQQTISAGEEMSLEQFLGYDEVIDLQEEGLVDMDDIDEIWASAVADAEGLNADEAYEVLCMLSDIPVPEDTKFLDAEFEKLSSGGEFISFGDVLRWADIRDMLEEGALDKETIQGLFDECTGSGKKMSREMFGEFNTAIDAALEDVFLTSDDSAISADEIWDLDFDPREAFDDEALQEVTDYFTSAAGSIDGDFSYRDLIEWVDVQEMIKEGMLTTEILQRGWEVAADSTSNNIDYDTFLRLNLELDYLMEMDEEEEADEE